MWANCLFVSSFPLCVHGPRRVHSWHLCVLRIWRSGVSGGGNSLHEPRSPTSILSSSLPGLCPSSYLAKKCLRCFLYCFASQKNLNILLARLPSRALRTLTHEQGRKGQLTGARVYLLAHLHSRCRRTTERSLELRASFWR